MKNSQRKTIKQKRILLVLLVLSTFSAGTLFGQELGDVNHDGSIRLTDALMVAQHYIGIYVPNFHTESADVDGNDKITITDALQIAQYVVGLISSFTGSTGPTNTPDPYGVAPKAAFTISNETPNLYQSVTFDASSSYDTDGYIVSYEWDFDDGTTASGVRVTHSFSDIDDYKVVLTVTDNSNISDDKKERVCAGRPDGWTTDTHSKGGDADYDLLFSLDSVPRIDITISSQNYQAMLDELNSMSMTIMMGTEDPSYVETTVNFNGHTWWHVGMRFKGQSTLSTPLMSGKKKFPFRLNFDKYEDSYPEINNQRFYGFDKMTFANCYWDSSYVRDVVCAEIFRNGGIVAANAAFARIYVNTGSGPVYWGLYSIIEDPSDQLLKYQFDNDEGNMYKPEGTGAEFSSFVQSAYVKKTNEDDGDYSDIQALISALNASRSNASSWRSNLERVFNVRAFLKWLAVNTTIVNFDTYGWVTKNFYIYQDLADDGRVVFIPWDFNLSLTSESPFGDMGMGGTDPWGGTTDPWDPWGGTTDPWDPWGGTTDPWDPWGGTNPWDPWGGGGWVMPTTGVMFPSPSLEEIPEGWPLIRYLMDDPVYNDYYHQEMENCLNGCFRENTVKSRISQLHNMIRSYVLSESSEFTYLTNGASEYDQAVTKLLNHISTRHSEIRNYLNSR